MMNSLAETSELVIQLNCAIAKAKSEGFIHTEEALVSVLRQVAEPQTTHHQTKEKIGTGHSTPVTYY